MPEQKPNAPDTLDASWPMSEAELRLQVDRKLPDPPPQDREEPEPLTLEQAQQKLNSKVQALLSADPKTLPNLVVEIQTLRVVCMLLAETKEGNTVFDANTYREMAMLNRMIGKGGTGLEDDDPNGALEDIKLEADAEARLAKRGITRDGAARLARVLGAAISRAGAPANTVPAPPEDDDEGDEPDMAPETTVQ